MVDYLVKINILLPKLLFSFMFTVYFLFVYSVILPYWIFNTNAKQYGMYLVYISYGVAIFSEMLRNKFKINLIHTESCSHKIISLAHWKKRKTSYKKIWSEQKMFQKLMGETGLKDYYWNITIHLFYLI